MWVSCGQSLDRRILRGGESKTGNGGDRAKWRENKMQCSGYFLQKTRELVVKFKATFTARQSENDQYLPRMKGEMLFAIPLLRSYTYNVTGVVIFLQSASNHVC